jgi:hypothetical protein
VSWPDVQTGAAEIDHCHRATHKGLLRIEGTAQNLRFARLDSEEVGSSGGAFRVG